jgi:hypothetical protein
MNKHDLSKKNISQEKDNEQLNNARVDYLSPIIENNICE